MSQQLTTSPSDVNTMYIIVHPSLEIYDNFQASLTKKHYVFPQPSPRPKTRAHLLHLLHNRGQDPTCPWTPTTASPGPARQGTPSAPGPACGFVEFVGTQVRYDERPDVLAPTQQCRTDP